MDTLAETTDEDIVRVVCDRDQEQYVHLVARYQARLLRYVTNLIHDDQAAKDVVQEAFIKAFINLKGFDTSKKFSSWIYRIAHNEAMNSVKKYRREVPLPETYEVASEEDIEADFMHQETAAAVQQRVAELPLIYAEPLVLRYVEDKSYDEISDILRLPLGTVGTRIRRAKALMKHLCQHH